MTIDTQRRPVLVVGGAGYVGSVLCAHLLERGYGVRSFDLLLYNNQGAVVPFLGRPGYRFVHGDLADAEAMTAALEGVGDVVLLGGLVGDPITKKYPEAARRINEGGYETILGLLDGRPLNSVVFVSTCSNYGLIEDDRLADEGCRLKPLSLYAKSKVAIENRILALHGKVDYAPTILRFATAFGLSPRMRFDLTLSEFTREMFLGHELLVYDPHTWRPYCHLRDLAEVVVRVLEAPRERVAFEVFNVGGEANNHTKRSIVEAILEQLPEARVRYQEHGSDPRNYRVDFTRVRERLNFEPEFTLEDGIRELIAAMRQSLFLDIDQPRGFYGNHEIDY